MEQIPVAPIATTAAPANPGPFPWRLVLAVAAVPAVLAVAQLGRLHPDEVYQTLEPAYFRAHGYGILAWEWKDGIRNWAIPGLFSWLLKLCAALGVGHPLGYRAVLELPQYALHAWMLGRVFRYAERRAGRAGGLLAVMLLGFEGTVLLFAGRTMSESFSTAFLVVAMEALDRAEEDRRAGALAGLTLGFAVVARYGSLVLVAAVLVWLAARRRWRSLAAMCLAGGAVAAGLAALDWLTWGKPLQSLLAYTHFNVSSGQAAARFGASQAGFYVPVLLKLLPLWAWPGLWLELRRGPKLPLPLFAALSYGVAVSATAHKEERFLYPALVLLALCAAPGFARALAAWARPRLRAGVASAALLAGLVPAAFQPDMRADQFRAIVRATRPADVTGLLIIGDGLWGVGGFFYIGKNIPWLTCDTPADYAFQFALHDRRFNRVVTFEDHALPELQAAGFRMIDRLGRETLLARP